MRLTLRTLLAYMDDILEPADHEDLGKKIESSDFATELIHRSRDTVRRLRLGAPSIEASDDDADHDYVLNTEMTADANTVAEYLDNTLPPESVAEFERICLEPGVNADVHLAEVSSCHHVLTMVLGEPAEIATHVRDRMYALPEQMASGMSLRIEPAHQTQGAASADPASAAETSRSKASPPVERVSSVSEVPDYLRAASDVRRSRIRRFTAAAILALVAFVAWFILTPPPEQDLPSGLGGSGMAALEEGLVIEGVEIDSSPSTEPSPDDQSQPPLFNPGEDNLTGDPTGDLENPAQPVTTEGEAETGARITDTPPLPDISEPELPPADAGPNAEPSTDDQPLDADTAVADPVEDETLTDVAEPAPPIAEGPVQVGNYLGSSSDVFLRRDATSGKWIRVPPQTAIFAGDRLLTLPKFRTHVSLADGNLYSSGGTHFGFPAPDLFAGHSKLTLEVVYGRLLLNAGLSGTEMALRVGDQFREVKLGGSASLAVEVRRVFIPGSDFEGETSPTEVVWYLTSGSVEWPSPEEGMQKITAPAAWKTVDGVDELPQPIEKLPPWIDGEEITDMERRARTTLAKDLKSGEPVGLTLLELNDPRGGGRRREVRTLAAESNLYVGVFEPFVKALSDSEQQRYWKSHLDNLREAMALSPTVAAQVREAFVNLRGQQAADDLMEMVRGYNEQDIGETREALQQGAMVDLLGWLESDSLDYRVLAIYNLNQITGTTNLMEPNAESTRRKRSIRKLWDRLEDNELLPASW
jgi:hypothetical protein